MMFEYTDEEDDSRSKDITNAECKASPVVQEASGQIVLADQPPDWRILCKAQMTKTWRKSVKENILVQDIITG